MKTKSNFKSNQKTLSIQLLFSAVFVIFLFYSCNKKAAYESKSVSTETSDMGSASASISTDSSNIMNSTAASYQDKKSGKWSIDSLLKKKREF